LGLGLAMGGVYAARWGGAIGKEEGLGRRMTEHE
jgi:hypothetical protein